MKTFKKIYLFSTIAFLAIWAFAFLLYNRQQNNNNRQDVVDMNRMVAEFERQLIDEGRPPEEIMNENPDLWKDVRFIGREEKEAYKVMMISGDGRDYFWSIYDADGEYMGMLQFSKGEREGKALLWLVGGMVGTFFLLQIGMLLIYKMYILPLHQLEQYPVRIARGDITEHLPETRYRNLGNFVWGINMLSDTLTKRQEDLNRAQAEKTGLLTGIAHGVKTPVANIRLYSEAVATGLYQPDGVPNESDREIAGKIQKNAEDIEDLLSKLLSTAADGNYAYQPVISSFYLKDMGERIRKNYDNRMKVNRIPFHVEIINNSIIQSDEDGINTILSQFLENAVKYGDGSGIRIVMEKQEDTYYFSVYNKGELLPDSELPYVFRSFWRGSNAENRPGSGMGMYTAREMAKQLQGEVYVRALKEQGEMEFTLILPGFVG